MFALCTASTQKSQKKQLDHPTQVVADRQQATKV